MSKLHILPLKLISHSEICLLTASILSAIRGNNIISGVVSTCQSFRAVRFSKFTELYIASIFAIMDYCLW